MNKQQIIKAYKCGRNIDNIALNNYYDLKNCAQNRTSQKAARREVEEIILNYLKVEKWRANQ